MSKHRILNTSNFSDEERRRLIIEQLNQPSSMLQHTLDIRDIVDALEVAKSKSNTLATSGLTNPRFLEDLRMLNDIIDYNLNWLHKFQAANDASNSNRYKNLDIITS